MWFSGGGGGVQVGSLKCLGINYKLIINNEGFSLVHNKLDL